MAQSFFFSGPTKTIVADDDGEAVTGCLRERERLLADAERALRRPGAGPGLLVGAVPFCELAPVRLFCPKRAAISGRWGLLDAPPETGQRCAGGGAPLSAELADTASEPFLSSVRDAVLAIQRGAIRK